MLGRELRVAVDHHARFPAAQNFEAWSFQEDRDGLMKALVHAAAKRNVLIHDATHFVIFEKHRDRRC